MELGFEQLDLLVLGILGGFRRAAMLESEVGVFEELALPLVEEGGVDLELIAKSRDGCALDEVAFDDGGLLLGREMTTLFVHDGTSVTVMLPRTEQFSRFD